MRDWKMWHKNAGRENAGLENAAQSWRGWKMQEWKKREKKIWNAVYRPKLIIWHFGMCARLNWQFSGSFQAHVISSSSYRICMKWIMQPRTPVCRFTSSRVCRGLHDPYYRQRQLLVCVQCRSRTSMMMTTRRRRSASTVATTSRQRMLDL